MLGSDMITKVVITAICLISFTMFGVKITEVRVMEYPKQKKVTKPADITYTIVWLLIALSSLYFGLKQ